MMADGWTEEELSLALIPVQVEMMQDLGWIEARDREAVVQTLTDRYHAKRRRLSVVIW